MFSIARPLKHLFGSSNDSKSNEADVFDDICLVDQPIGRPEFRKPAVEDLDVTLEEL
ncbi:hypothetical protein [Micromonospora sp. B9E7]|uniref:hypothetical protein n=1 Tax=Micromonospora sp. B9E7 TaxID=3153574 RepID=UPI00325DEE8D